MTAGGSAPSAAASRPHARRGRSAWALARAQQRAARAIAEGRYDRSLVPVIADDGTVILDREEFPRPQTTLESLQALAPHSNSAYRDQ